MQELQDKLHSIEMTQAFQDDVIEALQNTVAKQHQEIQTLQTQLRLLSEYLKTLREETIKDPNQEVPPPHY
ncbi:SlyX family protein [Thiomicrorhabdus sp. ZW0627]|uniref:SlyX family protein n=1 Tax=Thiomicrorhabdus sp. ZW0627 TaxID=3039774 RepID=UPI002436FDAB|nr:SlyX family protein [Thiomicrorhabdus sp. ZW0627]MDG6772940.1 SlyX family protein [Thiomicrorhabdus sp. ZW0627]